MGQESKKCRLGFTQHQGGFTLVEALTVFVIVGVIAVLVIPSLIKYKNDKEIVTSLKKAYNVLSNGYVLAGGSVGEINDWGLSEDFEGSKKVMSILSPYLNLERRCDGTTGCFRDVVYRYVDGSGYVSLDGVSDKSKAMFLDGMSFIVNSFKDCNNQIGNGKLNKTCAYIDIDINGFKKPNQYGKDTFSFYLTESGVVPVGGQADLTNTFEKDCKTGTGRACTAYILEHDGLWDGEITENPTPPPPTFGGKTDEECKDACSGSGTVCKDNASCKICRSGGWGGSLSCKIDYVAPPPANSIGGGKIIVDRPAGWLMNWSDASKYCSSQGKRLPNNSEIRQMADKIYSTGSDPFGLIGSGIWSSDSNGRTHYVGGFEASSFSFNSGYVDNRGVSVTCVKQIS